MIFVNPFLLNLFAGGDAGDTGANAEWNTFVGASAGAATSTTNSNGNTYVGAHAGMGLDGSFNSMFGAFAGIGTTGHNTGSENSFFGYEAGFGIQDGASNTIASRWS